MSEVLDEFARSDDPVERELAHALREYQRIRASRGMPRSVGYEPRDIRKLGAVEVIERRIRSEASGFDEVPAKDSYEAIVLKFQDRFKPEIVEIARKRIGEEEDAFRPTADLHLLDEQVRRLLARSHVPLPKGTKSPQRIDVSMPTFLRAPRVKAFVLQRARGRCEACGDEAPFKTLQEMGYLEVHHMKTLAKGGSDTVQNAVALCPNCHRGLHFASDAGDRAAKVYERLQVLVPE